MGLILDARVPSLPLGPTGCHDPYGLWRANALSPETGSVKTRSNDEIHE